MKIIRLLLCLTLLSLANVSHAQRPDNYPPDRTDVVIDRTNLPIVWLEVDHAMILRDEYITARMKIIDNGAGNLNYGDTIAHPGQHIDYNGYIALRYRGNTSFSQSDKKPYSIRPLDKPLEEGGTKKKVKLLGMGKDNKWALLAPYSDKSMMRDLLAFEISRPWMDYTPQGRYCEVYLDGIYYGVYILSEVVSKGKQRLNLDDPGTADDALTGGYLLEADQNEGFTIQSRYLPVSSTGEQLPCYVHYQYDTPDYEDMVMVQIQYIRARVSEMEDVMASWYYRDPVRGYRNYIDVESFADFQLSMELSHNVDGYRKSSKFFKRRDSEDPRFKMAIWDFNIAFGNCWKYENYKTDTWIYQTNDILYQNGETVLIPFWWYRLNNDPYYQRVIKDRWFQYRRNNVSYERLAAKLDSMAEVLTIYDAEYRNSQAWPRWGVRVWPNYYVASDLRDEIHYLKNWIKDRLDWMDEQLEYYSRHPRGDADGDENVNISDATVILDYLLTGNSDGVDLTAGDCNLDGNCDIQDVMLLIDYALNGTWHY